MTTHEKRNTTPHKESRYHGLASTKGKGAHKPRKSLSLSKLRHLGKHR